MSIKTAKSISSIQALSIKEVQENPSNKPLSEARNAKKESYLLALTIASSSLALGLSATTMTTQAAGLGDSFNGA